MSRLSLQIILAGVGVAFIAILFIQPKFTVINDETQLEENSSTTQSVVTKEEQGIAETVSSMHNTPGTAGEQKLIKKWTAKYNSFSSPEKKLIFADSLALLYSNLFEYDSAAKYFEQLAILNPNDTTKLKAGLGLYQSFKVSMNPTSRKETGLKALAYIDDLLKSRPNWTDLKVKKAVIKVYTEVPPMGGINMLKEIIAEYPNHIEARITLGEFMLTVQKVEKAIAQFEAVVSVSPDNEKALLYLVDCYQSLQNNTKAIQYLDQLDALDIKDEYIKSVIEKNRQELN